jgi:hypothetical protein
MLGMEEFFECNLNSDLVQWALKLWAVRKLWAATLSPKKNFLFFELITDHFIWQN